MISKAQIKFVKSLHQKKFRKIHLTFIAEGTKVAREILNSSFRVHKLYATASWLAKNTILLAHRNHLETIEATREELDAMSALTTPQEVLLLAGIPVYPASVKISAPVALALESIRDPGNLGTMIRICDWYGIPQLFCSEDCADIWNPKTIQASMGSIARVEVVNTDLEQLIMGNKTHTSLAAMLHGHINIHQASIRNPVLLIIGNEGQGISPALLAHTEEIVSIPRFGGAESLNASVAAAVLIDNLVRMRG